MSYAITLAQLKARVKERWLRSSTKFDNMLDNDVEEWIATLNDTFPYWFVTMFPGHDLQLTFPITTLSSVTPLAGRWVDTGWLITQAGVATYDFWHPVEDEESQNADWWALCKAQCVDFCYEFTARGSWNGALDIPEYESGLIQSSFNQQGRPTMMMWKTSETKSTLTFSPTPDKAYLYAIQFALKDPPFYNDSGQQRNRWLTHAPEAVILYANMKAAELANESKMKAEFAQELFGMPELNKRGSNTPQGGILGKMKDDTVKRTRSAREQLASYASMSQASGRLSNLNFNRQRWGRGRIGWW